MGRLIEDNRIFNRGLISDRNTIPKAKNQLGDYSEIDIRKSKHRSADSKYRSKVQFMYGKVKEITQVETTKDALLNDALKFIIRKEKILSKKLGKRNFEEFKKDYLRFLRQEDKLWKSVKDVNKWWIAVENSINKKQSLADLHSHVFDENDGFEKICRMHDEEWAYQPSEVHVPFDCTPLLREQIRKQSLKNSTTIGSVSCDKHLNPAPSNNLSNSVYIPNNMHHSNNNIPLETSHDQYHIDTRNELKFVDLGFFALNKPIEFCEYRNPTEAGIYDSFSTINNVSSTLLSL